MGSQMDTFESLTNELYLNSGLKYSAVGEKKKEEVEMNDCIIISNSGTDYELYTFKTVENSFILPFLVPLKYYSQVGKISIFQNDEIEYFFLMTLMRI